MSQYKQRREKWMWYFCSEFPSRVFFFSFYSQPAYIVLSCPSVFGIDSQFCERQHKTQMPLEVEPPVNRSEFTARSREQVRSSSPKLQHGSFTTTLAHRHTLVLDSGSQHNLFLLTMECRSRSSTSWVVDEDRNQRFSEKIWENKVEIKTQQ